MALTPVELVDGSIFYLGVIDSTNTVLEEGTIVFCPPGETIITKFKYPGQTFDDPSKHWARSEFLLKKNPFESGTDKSNGYIEFGVYDDKGEHFTFDQSSYWVGGGDLLGGICLSPDGKYIKSIWRHEDEEEWDVSPSETPVIYAIDVSKTPNPKPGEEPSGPGGGGGTLDEQSDPIDFPSAPGLSASATGLITLYSPSIAQLRSLAQYMWSDEFNLDTFKKLFADPMDVIIGLSIVPVQPNIAGSQSIKIGLIDTGVSCNLIDSQYMTISCGSINVSEYWGTALDYSPYTKFSIYLPFIGTRELKTDDIMKRTISVQYLIDILSGACTACVKCGESVLYQYSGSCAASIPITGQNWNDMITSVIQLAGAGIAAVATGGAGAAGLIPSSANAIASMKPTVQRAGAVSGAAGMLGIQKPYLIWEHPRQSLATGYNRYVGYPSNITEGLGTLTGFTQIECIHLEGIPATQTELAEIEDLLKAGVIL